MPKKLNNLLRIKAWNSILQKRLILIVKIYLSFTSKLRVIIILLRLIGILLLIFVDIDSNIKKFTSIRPSEWKDKILILLD